MQNVIWPLDSGHQLTFATYPIGTAFRPIPGIYIFCKKGSGSTWSACYVGETINLADRLNRCQLTHHAFERARRYGATHLGIYTRSDMGRRAARLAIETALRRRLRPPANDQ